MATSIDDALGIHPKALSLAQRRTEILSANLANADTPNYKARDIDFEGAMRAEMGRQKGLQMTRTNAGHLGSHGTDSGAIQYRVPNQPSIDGNTVDAAEEQTRFAENSMRYMASLDFVEGTFQKLKKAVRGQ
jgi:flagellar basal-body rod protein FlgB